MVPVWGVRGRYTQAKLDALGEEFRDVGLDVDNDGEDYADAGMDQNQAPSFASPFQMFGLQDRSDEAEAATPPPRSPSPSPPGWSRSTLEMHYPDENFSYMDQSRDVSQDVSMMSLGDRLPVLGQNVPAVPRNTLTETFLTSTANVEENLASVSHALAALNDGDGGNVENLPNRDAAVPLVPPPPPDISLAVSPGPLGSIVSSSS